MEPSEPTEEMYTQEYMKASIDAIDKIRSIVEHNSKYTVYDEMGKILIITSIKRIALQHLPSKKAA